MLLVSRRPRAADIVTVLLVLAAAALASGCGRGRSGAAPAARAAADSSGPARASNPASTWKAGVMQLTSPAFSPEGAIPVRHACDGQDLSPPLAWTGAPAGTVGYALVCDDPDAPAGTWDHWVVYAIPADRAALPEGVAKEAQLPDGVRQGLNGWKKPGYGGPCPPPGKAHRYFFRIYALAAPIDLAPGATKERLLAAIQGKVLATGTLMGTFKR